MCVYTNLSLSLSPLSLSLSSLVFPAGLCHFFSSLCFLGVTLQVPSFPSCCDSSGPFLPFLGSFFQNTSAHALTQWRFTLQAQPGVHQHF